MRITDSWLAALFGIGLAPGEITPLQMAARAVAIYLLALLCIRAVDKRFLVRNSPFDVLVTVILGSTLSQTITGQAAFWPALVASAALIAAHWAFNALSFHSRLLAILLKGQPFVIVKDGQPIWENMQTVNFSKADLEQKLREHGDLTIDDVELAMVSLVVTEMAVIEPTAEGLMLRERAPGVSVADIVKATGTKLTIPETVPEMELP